MPPLLECHGLGCGYHGKHVLEGIHLSVSVGESVALLGPNGSGKSTLLKTIARTLAPQAGTISLGGTPASKLGFDEVARRVAFVPQEEDTSFPFLVREIVAMGRLPYARSLKESDQDRLICAEAMATADCADYADRPITELSGGERQRVLIARALAQEAPLLLLDEPTSHLDVRHQLSVAALLKGLITSGKAVVAAVHDLNLASLVADRGVLLSKGKVVLDLPIRDLLQNPILDEVYSVRFHRHDDDGTLRVFGVC